MTLLFDQNLSYRLVTLLAQEYPGSEHVREVGLSNSNDDEIWSYARDRDHIIVSKDVDFRHLSTLRGSPPKVIWLRIGNGPTSDAENLMRSNHGAVAGFAADSTTAVLVLPQGA